MIELTDSEHKRFWSKVTKTDSCWLWTGGTRAGYGLFRLRNKMWSAHRLSYAIHTGDVGNHRVRHTCDNPPCVNPAHLLLGSDKDNSDDKMVRDRHNFLLSNKQVLDIRSRPLSPTMCKELAIEFGTSTEVIKRALTGESYDWLPGARDIPEQFTAYKLTPEQVDDILTRAASGKWGIKTQLAKEYGVTKGHISHITNNRLKYTQNTDTE